MNGNADFCWVGADGALQNGTERALVSEFEAGRLPPDHPVWHPHWGEWVALGDALSRHLLQSSTGEDAPSTLPSPMSFDETLSLDADATLEDLTIPRGMAVFRVSECPESLAPATLPSKAPEPAEWVAPPAIAPVTGWTRSDAPPGYSHSVLPSAPPAGSRPLLPALLGLGIALVGASVASGVIALALIPARASSPAAHLPLPQAPRVEAAPAKPELANTCRSTAAARALLERVELGTPIEAVPSESDRPKLGVVTSSRTGLGLEIAVDPLEVTARTPVADPVHVAGVSAAGSSFGADRFARSVPAAQRFSLGMTPSGFARIADDGQQTTLWSGESAQLITRPALAHAEGFGWAVAFRRGADAASVRLGWLDEQGAKKSELGTLSVASGLVEAPSVAVGGGEVVLAYAARQPAEAPFGIELARAKLGELPSSSLRLGGGGSEDRHAPSVAALARGRWLVAWAEGSKQSGRTLHAQMFDANLRPIGTELSLWRGANFVGTTALVVEGERVLVLFTERTSRQTERLLGATLECR